MIYRDFTCAPEDTCPTPVDIIHERMNKTKASEVTWKLSLSTSSNCRISVKADSSLNGRLIVKINKIKAALVLAVHLQPNNFNNDEYGTHGILPNNLYYLDQEEGAKFEVPTDWTVFIVYSNGYFPGSLSIFSGVFEYTEKDLHILDEMQPTGTYYVNKTAIAIKQ